MGGDVGAGFITLSGFISRSVALPPQGLSENVLWPFVVHSQIWLPDAMGAPAGCTGSSVSAGSGGGVVAGTGAGAGADTAMGAAGGAGA